MNLLSDLIEHGDVDHGALFDALYILLGLDQVMAGYNVAHDLKTADLVVKCEVTALVFFSASAPAGCIPIQSLDNHFFSFPSLRIK